MRELADAAHIKQFMSALGRAAKVEGRVYLVELAAPSDFIPVPDGWEDLLDVKEMLASGLVDPADALAQFDSIEPELYRFSAIDPPSFRRSVEELFR